MGTNTANSAAVHLPLPVPKILGAWLTYASPGTTIAKTLGVLPVGAMVLGGGAFVTVAFDDTGTDTIDIGTTGDADEYGSALDVSSVGYKVNDEIATENGYSGTAEVTVQATYTGQNANAAAGKAFCFVAFIEPEQVAGPSP